MADVKVNPNISALVISLRSIGYSFENAISDIIDNSITANATEISINCNWDGINPYVEIIDNGIGMNYEELINAMVLGSKSKKEIRDRDDLGRFGLGLKTASFSQCKKLTVITKQNEKILQAIYDLEKVVKENDLTIDLTEPKEFDTLESQGTFVKWELIDTLEKKNKVDSQNYFNNLINDLEKHISLYFHRFLAGDKTKKITINLNNIACKPYNPFFVERSEKLPLEIIDDLNTSCKVQAYTLPHHQKVNNFEWELYAGKEGYLANQGFYLYRNNRLIIKGTWFKLRAKKEETKLSRIAIDIDNTCDEFWQIDVKKSSAEPPLTVRSKLKKIVDRFTAPAKKKINNRGAKLHNQDALPIWKRIINDHKIQYSVSKEHPKIESFKKQLIEDNKKGFDEILDLIDSTIPLSSIYTDYSEAPKNIEIKELPDQELLEHAKDMIKTLLEKTDFSKEEIINKIRFSEPFKSNWEQLEENL